MLLWLRRYILKVFYNEEYELKFKCGIVCFFLELDVDIKFYKKKRNFNLDLEDFGNYFN